MVVCLKVRSVGQPFILLAGEATFPSSLSLVLSISAQSSEWQCSLEGLREHNGQELQFWNQIWQTLTQIYAPKISTYQLAFAV